jgi:hypothetical protein
VGENLYRPLSLSGVVCAQAGAAESSTAITGKARIRVIEDLGIAAPSWRILLA